MRTEPSFSAEPDDHLDVAPDNINRIASDSDAGLLSDYRQRYGLSMDPFVDDPHFPFYQGAQRRQILEQLLHLCQFSNNLIVVAGDYGVGKTRMAQALIDSLDDADDICFIEGQITSDIDSVFAEVLDQFELPSKTEFTDLCIKKSDQDGLVVLIVDNAHHLTDEVIADLINLLEENFESRLHLVMFAEPHLLERLNNINAPDIVLTDFLLEKFSLAEAVDYLNFRMEMADYLGPEIFVESKVEPWWRQAQGQLLMLHDHAQEKLLETVSASRNIREHKRNMLVPHIVASSVLIGGLIIGYLYVGADDGEQKVGQITESVPIATQISSAAASVQSSSQFSSSPALDPAAVVLSTGGAEQTYSSASVSVSSVNTVSNENLPQSQEVKQSVVPLAQASNDAHSEAAQRLSSSATKSSAPANNSSKAKTIAKAKNENVGDGLPKASTAYSAQEKTILSWNESEFTLQIVGLSSEKSALEFIAAQSNKKDLLLFKSVRQGKDWYVVVTGRYSSSLKAKQAIEQLPDIQKKAGPWPRLVSEIQKEIKNG